MRDARGHRRVRRCDRMTYHFAGEGGADDHLLGLHGDVLLHELALRLLGGLGLRHGGDDDRAAGLDSLAGLGAEAGLRGGGDGDGERSDGAASRVAAEPRGVSGGRPWWRRIRTRISTPDANQRRGVSSVAGGRSRAYLDGRGHGGHGRHGGHVYENERRCGRCTRASGNARRVPDAEKRFSSVAADEESYRQSPAEKDGVRARG